MTVWIEKIRNENLTLDNEVSLNPGKPCSGAIIPMMRQKSGPFFGGIGPFVSGIPSGPSNAGHYAIAPALGIHCLRWIVRMGPAVSFDAYLNDSVSPYWTSQSDGRRQGPLAPILPWRALEAKITTTLHFLSFGDGSFDLRASARRIAKEAARRNCLHQ